MVDPPGVKTLQRYIPAVLRRPLPEGVPAPATGSADWLLRDVGKVGRHFTRALLSIIKAHLEEEKVALDAANHALIQRHAQDAILEYVRRTP